MPARRVPAAVHREIDGVRKWLAEQQEATCLCDDQARTQTIILEQYLDCLNEMANPHSAFPAPIAQDPPPSS